MINIEIRNRVAWVKIDRPKQKNALSIALLKQLITNLKALDNQSEVRVIVIFGQEHFSAGGDIKDMMAFETSAALPMAHEVQNLYTSISNLTKPIIAYTKGLVFGGGMELALVCDFIVSESNAKFSLPETALGIVPGGGATQRLKAQIGQQNAAYLLLTGSIFSAEKMLQMNFIQEIVNNQSDVKAIAQSIAQKNPNAIKELKQLLKLDLDLEAESESFARLLLNDGQKGIKSFIEDKRPPKW